MEQTIKVCDYCRDEKLAVETLVIKRELGRTLTKDVCVDHLSMILGTEKPRNVTSLQVVTKTGGVAYDVNMRCDIHEFESSGTGMGQHFRWMHQGASYTDSKGALRAAYDRVHGVAS